MNERYETYQVKLRRHLADYKRRVLGVAEDGLWRGKPYDHVLPAALKRLNLLAPELIEDHVARHGIRLHRDFHHLNSSQAMAFNLFIPMLSGRASPALAQALGVSGPLDYWSIEHIPERGEDTNVDAMFRTADGTSWFCEVKLSEAEFGQCVANPARQKKRQLTYLPRLAGLIDDVAAVDERWFWAHYQLLRNLSLLGKVADSRLILLLPRQNDSLGKVLGRFLPRLTAVAARRLGVVYLEDLVDRLLRDDTVSPRDRNYLALFSQKYVLPAAAITSRPS
jgi:hypothetical protein